jgi:hypothetical protein
MRSVGARAASRLALRPAIMTTAYARAVAGRKK